MTGSVFIIEGLVKILVFVNLSKFRHQFSCTQKWLPTLKTPCIIPWHMTKFKTSPPPLHEDIIRKNYRKEFFRKGREIGNFTG